MTHVDPRSWNVMSICAGIGGLDLGLRIAMPDARTVCYLEIEAFACEILVSRMQDGSLDEAPIWTDLGTFDGRPWRGAVDCITTGLPCQPYSVAGQRRGDADERYIWPDFFRIVREVQPAMVFLENVPGFVAWFRPVGEELCRLGYELEAGIFSAAEVGASHRRERFFILAHCECPRWPQAWTRAGQHSGCEPEAGSGSLDFPPGPGEQAEWRRILDQWPEVEPAVCRVADGTASRLDRLRALGNGVVPLQAAYAFRVLARKIA